MIFVNEQVKEFCKSKELPPPSKNDLENLGRLISYHFRNYYCSSVKPGAVIDGAGLAKVQENSEYIVASFYPYAFKEEMLSKIETFYMCKLRRIEQDKVKPRRKRIPMKVASSKALKSSNGNESR